MNTAVKPVPEGMQSLIPHLVCAGAAEAIDFYIKAFGATEVNRMPAPDSGRLMNAMIRIGDSMMMLVDEMPEFGALGPKALKGTPVTMHMYVENADASFERAVQAGATPVLPLADMFWGDRYGIVEDPFGHRWSIATHQHDYTHEQIHAGMMRDCT
jgi:PhnB protein